MEKVIRPVFTLELNYKIVPGLVTVGKYDGTHPCLTAATNADKVLIHSPHRRNVVTTGRIIWSESNREIAILNINQTITALAAGKVIPDETKDILVVGTPTHIMGYHVNDNKDIFYKECPDGAKAICIGKFREHQNPMILVGGNSSIHAFDHTGTEIFWTAVGDVITSLILLDYNKDGLNELAVSSNDYNIRIYKDDQIIAEQTETEVVTGLANLPDNRFAYTLSNGTVGVYEQEVRLWRVKSKNIAISTHSYDLLGKGTAQLITGWSNGKIDCRTARTGEVVFKDTLNHGAAGIVEADYRSLGKTDIICVSVEGEVRGYTTTKCLDSASAGSGMEQDTVRELLAQKQGLLLELKHYENNTKFNDEYLSKENVESAGSIPANTRLQIGIATNDTQDKPCIQISVSTNNDTIIRAVMVFAEGIFKGETHVVLPPLSKVSGELSVPLYPPKDVAVDIHIKALIGYAGSTQFHVFELTRQIPKFSMYTLVENPLSIPDSYVQFKINERLQRICMWINQNFLLENDIEYGTKPDLTIIMKSLRENEHIMLVFESTGKVTFYTKNLLLAADLVQSLANYLNLDFLTSKANFPEEEIKFANYMERIKDVQEARLKLGTDVAAKLGQIRSLIVRAEDSRINAISDITKYYVELNSLNKELISGYNIKLANHNEGLDAIKNINAIIQRASRLRVGKPSSSLISSCKNAIKNNNSDALIKIIRTGEQ